ncbi:MAG: P-II family nitrogen regulator [Candidatus Alcyoniella australis]|nr:P-II family nitrogen regulator [Candidatus Alcyoniella australis]
MLLLGCVISNPDLAEEVLAAMIEAGITTATVVESQGMGRVISERMPIFAGFRNLWGGAEPYGRFIFTIVEPAQADAVIPLLKDVIFDTKGDGKAKGVIFTLPVAEFHKPSPAR